MARRRPSPIDQLPWLLAASLSLASACAAPLAEGDAEGGDAIGHGGKADDYYSDRAREFAVTGTVDLELATADDGADQGTESPSIDQIADTRLTAVALYLTAYLSEKIEEFPNAGYGGFHAMVRNRSATAVAVRSDGHGGLSLDFRIDVAGPSDLPSLLGIDGQGRFRFTMPVAATAAGSMDDWFGIREFDPRTFQGDLEEVVASIAALPVPLDAYPPYDAFADDGVIDLTLWHGWDYNDVRMDLVEGFLVFYALWSLGFQGPDERTLLTMPDANVITKLREAIDPAGYVGHVVDLAERYARLTADSGPMNRTVMVGGQQIRLEAYSFHAEMFRGRADLKARFLAELGARDMIFYTGHAGPGFGYMLGDDLAGYVDSSEIADALLPTKAQLVVATGCQTYSQYADDLYANPAKSEFNLDVITSVNFSYNDGVDQLVADLLQIDMNNNLMPQSYGHLLAAMNASATNAAESVFYGVTGIDGNSRIHPFAAIGAIGRPCVEDADCGDPSGNVCWDGTCGARALPGATCPSRSELRSRPSPEMWIVDDVVACVATAPTAATFPGPHPGVR